MKNQAEDSMPSYSYLRLDADDQLTVLLEWCHEDDCLAG